MEKAVNQHFTDKATGNDNGDDGNDGGKLWIVYVFKWRWWRRWKVMLKEYDGCDHDRDKW